jgi:allantoinase
VLDGESFDAKCRAAEANSRTDFALWGGLTPDNLDKLEELARRGVVGFKAFMSNSGVDDFRRADDLTLLRGMGTAASLGLPVAVHAESEEITTRLTAEARAAGGKGVRDYLTSRPVIAEVEAIRRAIGLARETKCSLHVVHVSSVEGVREVQHGTRRIFTGPIGVDVTCETCPHYLSFSDEDAVELGASTKCAPPLRERREVEALWLEVLHRGTVCFVASDHSPAPPSMKSAGDFFDIWGGIAGVQSTLAILLSHDWANPRKVADLTATRAATRFGIPQKGQIAVHLDADLALVDLDANYELTREMLLDRHRLSPYVGRKFRGRIRQTIVRGHTVFQDGRIVGDFRGRLITPSHRGVPHA